MVERGGIQNFSQSTLRGVYADSFAPRERNALDSAPRGEGGVGDPRIERPPTTAQLLLGDRAVVVSDPEMIRIYGLLERLARTQLPVVIRGESGVGKEYAARAVHAWSARAAAPFLVLNCATMQDGLLEAELFGCEHDAVPGAMTSKPGLLERADGGTVFLDEVNALSLAAQAQLLRVLESQRVTRLGDTHERAIDIRIIAATHGDLLGEIAAGRFRRDLYFRLNGAIVALPPLRARPSEIPTLAHHFLVAARDRQGDDPVVISPAAMQHLLVYPWIGNLRELKHAMEYAAALLDGDRVEPWHLPEAVVQEPQATPAHDDATPAVPPAHLPSYDRPAESFRPVAEELRALERRRMIEALRVTGGVQRRAAQLIGMPVRTFTCKLTQYGLRGVWDRG